MYFTLLFVCGIRSSVPELRFSTQRVTCPCCLKLCLLFTLWIFLDRRCFEANIFYSGPWIRCIFPPFSGVYRIHIYASSLKNYFTFKSEYFFRSLTHVGLSAKDVVIYFFFPNNFYGLILNSTHDYIKSCQLVFYNTFSSLFGGNFFFIYLEKPHFVYTFCAC